MILQVQRFCRGSAEVLRFIKVLVQGRRCRAGAELVQRC